MKIINWLRKMRFNPVFIKLTGLLCLRAFLKKVYYKFIFFADSKIKIKLFGYAVQFYTRKLDEYILIEDTLIDKREGEIRVIQKMLEELRPSDNVYDIGASIGTHAVFLALKVSPNGRVFAFEPEIKSFEILKNNIALNRIDNITVFQLALSDDEGEADIRKLVCFTISDNSNFTLVNKTRLVKGDNFIKNNNLSLPNVVKIDVEGFEYRVIKGLENTLKNQVCRMVACEIHPVLLPDGIKVSNVVELLKSYGFDRTEVYNRGDTLHAFFYKGERK